MTRPLITNPHHVFHLYNRANDRGTLFFEDRNYTYFLTKVVNSFREAAHILGYCLMPNHFHLLIVPKQPLKVDLDYSDKILPRLPTDEVSEAMRRSLMGFTKGYNRDLVLTGSRWQQRTKCKHHYRSLHYGLRYVHYNPVEAGLVKHPSEWGYSSFNEYTGVLHPDDHVCNTRLGKYLLHKGMLH